MRTKLRDLIEEVLNAGQYDREQGVAWLTEEAGIKWAKENKFLLEAMVNLRNYIDEEGCDDVDA